MPRPLSFRKRLLFSLLPLLALFIVIELLASVLAWRGGWEQSALIFEDAGRTIHFDSIRGARLTNTPSRMLRMTNGALEYVGTIRGNNQGFPDRDDFGPERPNPAALRIAVFGDSFTEAQYLGQNWPDRVEDLARANKTPIELLNFAISGGGLANWWSTLTRIVEAENYELDGVIFAVYPSDLRRKFTFWDFRDTPQPRFGRARSWDPATYPTSLEAAQPLFEPFPAKILAPADFERVLQNQRASSPSGPLRPFFLTLATRQIRALVTPAPPLPKPESDPARDQLINDIKRALDARHLPALVVHLPDRAGLLNPPGDSAWALPEARAFAEAIDARFLDATPAFASLSAAQIRDHFLPHDGHWNQAGSNRFADFILNTINNHWPQIR